MPVISKQCDIYIATKSKIKYGHFDTNIMEFLMDVAIRAGTFNQDVLSGMLGKNDSTTQTLVFKKINMLRAQLNTKLEQEKKEGKELSQDDIEMIHILENELPDILINYCSRQRNSENMKNLAEGGYRRKTKKNRNKKSRKNRK